MFYMYFFTINPGQSRSHAKIERNFYKTNFLIRSFTKLVLVMFVTFGKSVLASCAQPHALHAVAEVPSLCIPALMYAAVSSHLEMAPSFFHTNYFQSIIRNVRGSMVLCLLSEQCGRQTSGLMILMMMAMMTIIKTSTMEATATMTIMTINYIVKGIQWVIIYFCVEFTYSILSNVVLGKTDFEIIFTSFFEFLRF